MIGIYAIIHQDSGRRYIGSSKAIEKRWRQHLRELGADSHHSAHLQRAWNRYGCNAFRFVVLEQCGEDERLDREQAWLTVTRAANPEHGFNILATAHCGARPHGKRDPAVGQKISAALKGRPLSEERKRKIGAAHLGKKRGPHSPEHCERIRQASLKHRHSQATKDKIKRNHWSRSEQAEAIKQRIRDAKRRPHLHLVIKGAA